MTQNDSPKTTYPLWPGLPQASEEAPGFSPYIEIFLADTDTPRGAVVVLPGGGYSGRAPHEAEPIARRFNEAGLHAVVTHYRVAPSRFPAALSDAARAVRITRAFAEAWRIRPDHIAILGFSAGGHLAASLGVLHHEATTLDDDIGHITCRPDALVLCYPVITSGEFAHRGSFANLLGPDAQASMLEHVSLELSVSASTPPTFLWHTVEDAGVPVENSLLFASALRKNGVPFELHVYPKGRHGMGLAPEDPHVASWFELCVGWLEGMGW